MNFVPPWRESGWQAQLIEPPLRDELLDVERLQDHARALAARLTVDPRPRRRRRLLGRLEDNARVLARTYRLLADDVRARLHVSPAGEWMLDNYHLVLAEIRSLREYLPRRYYAQLPVLATADHTGDVRAYAMAVEIVRHSDSRLDRQQLIAFLNSYQTVAPLTIGELWAWPSMLRLALLENLRRLADEILMVREARQAADRYVSGLEDGRTYAPPDWPPRAFSSFVVQLLHRIRDHGPLLQSVQAAIDAEVEARGTTGDDLVREEHQHQATAQVLVANVITSLRTSASLDWRQLFEAVSVVEQVLRRDPAGAYTRMDFHGRDRQRKAVEALAAPDGDAQVRVALRAIESARQAAGAGRAAHVGYHLIGDGRARFEADVAFRRTGFHRLAALARRHATATYLGAIGGGTAVGLALADYVLRTHGAGPELRVVVALVTLVSFSEVAVALVNRLVTALAAPERLPRLEFADGIPETERTMVIVPTLFTSVDGVRALIEQLEVAALGNLDPHLHFALLSDLADGDAQHQAGDAVLVQTAVDGIEALNRRPWSDGGQRFFLFHRERRWNPGEQAWMGWERKRGKIEEFNRRLRGATDTSFVVEVGAIDLLPSVRYCLTLDSDTRLPRDAARALVGVIAHPLNRPTVDRALGRVVEGYAVLQPRVSVTIASAAGSLFSRLYAGHTGVDPYTTAVSDVYQDFFGEGIFTGKGLYDVDAFREVLEGRVPENTVLSHDLFEGLYARTALVSDVEVVDDYPSSVLAHTRRLHRWVRGDWQLLWWLFPWVPAHGRVERNRLPLISRWKLFDNLRRSLVAPATMALLLLAWTTLPGSAGAWTAAALAAPAIPLVLRSAEAATWLLRGRIARAFSRVLWADVKTDMARVTLQVVFLAQHDVLDAPCHRADVDAPGVHAPPAARMGDGGGDRGAGLRARHADVPVCDERRPALALVTLVAVSATQPMALPIAAPFVAMWAAGAGGRAPAQPPGTAAPSRAGGRRSQLPRGGGARHVALLRSARHQRTQRAAARQRAAGARAARGATHVADQHRHEPAGRGGGARPRIPVARGARRPDRRHDGDDRAAGAPPRPPAQLVRHRDPGAAVARPTSRRWTAAISPAR